MLQKSEVTTTTDDPFSPLFETAARRTHRGWCLQYMGPNQGRTSVTRWSLFDHSGPLILSEKPSIMPIDSNHRNTRHRQFPGEYRHYSARQHGDSGRTRTPNLLIRSQLLYPVELRNLSASLIDRLRRRTATNPRVLPEIPEKVQTAEAD